MHYRRPPSPSTQNSPAPNPIGSDDPPSTSVGSDSAEEDLMAEYQRYKNLWDTSRCSGDLTYELTRMKTNIVTQCICIQLGSLFGKDRDSAFWNLLAFMEVAKFLRSRYRPMRIFILNKSHNKFLLQEEEILKALAIIYGDGDGSSFHIAYTHTLSQWLSAYRTALIFNANQQPEPLLCMERNLSGIYIGRNDDICLVSSADAAESKTLLKKADSVEFPAKRPNYNELWSRSDADPALGSMVPLRQLRIWWSGEHSETIVI